MIRYIDSHKAQLIVEVGTQGKRKKKTKMITYNGKRDAKMQYNAFEAEVRSEICTDLTVRDVCESYIKNCEINGLEPTTIHGYEIALKRIILRFERISATSLTTYQVEDLIAEMSEKYKPKTIANTIGFLSAAYQRAIRTGQLEHNPCANATLPKRKQDEVKTLSEEEVIDLLDKLQDELIDYKVGYELCLLCGLRRSEVLGLKHEDFNPVFKCIYIHETRHIVNGEESIQGTKTSRSHRTVAVPQMVCDDIEELIKSHEPYDSDYLIQDGFGEPRHPSTFSNHIYKLTNVGCHALRHTFATMLNAEGVDIARISSVLGHSNITTTLNKYTHVFGNVSDSSRGIADALDAKFSKQGACLGARAKKKA